MSALDTLVMWCIAVAFAAVCDLLWVHQIRPMLAEIYGWPELDKDEIIPTWAWVGALIVSTIFFVAVPFIGEAAGF